MHPLISHFPSDTFYDQQIQNAAEVVNKRLEGELREIEKFFRKRSIFFDLKKSVESSQSSSKFNPEEARFTYFFLKKLIEIATKNRGLQ